MMTTLSRLPCFILFTQVAIQYWFNDYLPQLCDATTTTALCSGRQYSNGQWERRTAPASTSENFEVCTDPYYPRFKLQPICTEPGVPMVIDNGDSCREEFFSLNPNASAGEYHAVALDYVFKPNTCELVEWNELKFCELLGDRNVLMIGDSTMAQTAETLRSMLYQGRARAYNYTIQNGLKSCFNNIEYLESDHLVHFNYEGKLHRSRDRGSTLAKDVIQSHKSADFIIFGTGFHFQLPEQQLAKNDSSFVDYMIPRLEEEIALLRDLCFDKSNVPMRSMPVFILKTENPAHDHCRDFTAPENSFYNVDRYRELNHGSKYHWDSEIEFDLRLMDMALKNDISIIRMDPLYQRPDAHSKKECLHYCAPGPVNLFARLFLHFLTVGVEKWREGEQYVPMADSAI